VFAVVTPFIIQSSQAPRLLVSVRNSAEALAAVAGGCDILDIKEPNHGSLGMADPSVSAHIIQSVRSLNQAIPISMALGEVTDWQANSSAKNMGLTAAHLTSCSFLKMGCAGLRSLPDWRTTWNQARHAVTRSQVQPARWVAVAYADWEAADAPPVSEIVRAALQDDCEGVLIDTSTKSNRWLLDWISLDELQAIADQVHSRGLFLALAGSLTISKIAQLKSVAVDILAIRGAACLQGERKSEICERSVRTFQQQIAAIWSTSSID
jgi:uncharacterized protein (UPF0264 family)